MNTTHTLYFDGASRPSGESGMGFVVKDGNGVVHTYGIVNQGYTVNEAEYGSLILGLEWCLEQGIERLLVKGDSQLVIQQMVGKYACRAANLKDWHAEAKRLAALFGSIKFQWVRREKNKLADAATRDLMEEKSGRP